MFINLICLVQVFHRINYQLEEVNLQNFERLSVEDQSFKALLYFRHPLSSLSQPLASLYFLKQHKMIKNQHKKNLIILFFKFLNQFNLHLFSLVLSRNRSDSLFQFLYSHRLKNVFFLRFYYNKTMNN